MSTLLRRQTLEPGKDFPYLGAMITSRLTSKAQTTVPQAVRTALGLRPGDELAYSIEQDGVVLTRRPAPADEEDPFAGFGEWDSACDAQAYAGF